MTHAIPPKHRLARALFEPPKPFPEPPALLGCERSRKGQAATLCPQPPAPSPDLAHGATCLRNHPPPPRQGRDQRSATLQKTGILTSEPFPALGQPVCANGFSHSHCGQGKGPTLLCTGVDRWDAIYQGRRALSHRKMHMKNWETRETKVRKVKSKERTRAHP